MDLSRTPSRTVEPSPHKMSMHTVEPVVLASCAPCCVGARTACVMLCTSCCAAGTGDEVPRTTPCTGVLSTTAGAGVGALCATPCTSCCAAGSWPCCCASASVRWTIHRRTCAHPSFDSCCRVSSRSAGSGGFGAGASRFMSSMSCASCTGDEVPCTKPCTTCVDAAGVEALRATPCTSCCTAGAGAGAVCDAMSCCRFLAACAPKMSASHPRASVVVASWVIRVCSMGLGVPSGPLSLRVRSVSPSHSGSGSDFTELLRPAVDPGVLTCLVAGFMPTPPMTAYAGATETSGQYTRDGRPSSPSGVRGYSLCVSVKTSLPSTHSVAGTRVSSLL